MGSSLLTFQDLKKKVGPLASYEPAKRPVYLLKGNNQVSVKAMTRKQNIIGLSSWYVTCNLSKMLKPYLRISQKEEEEFH